MQQICFCRLIEVEYAEIQDRKVRGQLQNVSAIERQVSPVAVNHHNHVESKGDLIISGSTLHRSVLASCSVTCASSIRYMMACYVSRQAESDVVVVPSEI